MEARKSIRSYIGPGPAAAVVLAALLLAILLCALTGERVRPASRPEPVAFDEAQTDADRDAFLDVVAVSEAICSFGEDRFYYVAEDDAFRFRIVCLNTEEYAALEAQRDYWNTVITEPSVSRVVGRKYPISDDVKRGFMTVFGMESEAFDANFGAFCLITQPEPEPVRTIGHPVGVVLFSLLFLLACGGTLWQLLTAWAALTRLEETDALERAGKELLAEDTKLLKGDRIRLGKSFLFGWRSGLAAAWRDILWCYGRQFPFGHLLMLCTADGRRHPVFFRKGEETALRGLTAAIAARNAAVLMGQSAENRDAWQRACRS